MKKIEKATLKANFDVKPHPLKIFGIPVNSNITESGIHLPEQSQPKTPIVEIISMGKDVDVTFGSFDGKKLEVGDLVYAVPEYMRFIEIKNKVYVELMIDGIFGIKSNGTV